MNIVYKLINVDKTEGPKFYIGSKVECKVIEEDGFNIIIDNKTEMPYIGSSSNQIFKEDLISGCRFTVEVLERVLNRRNLLSVEAKYLKEINAKNNEDYYNLTNETMSSRYNCQDCPINYLGETLKAYSASKSGLSKRIKTAKKLGFNSFHKCVIHIYERSKVIKTFSEIAKELGVERHKPANIIKGINIPKCIEEINNYSTEIYFETEKLYLKKVSYHKIAELLNLELPTVAMYLQDYIGKKSNYLTAKRAGYSEEELTKKIIKLFLQGNSVKQACKQLNINWYSGQRYFYKYLRKRLDINDI